MIESIEQLRKDADTCTQMAGVDDNFETVWITKSALLEDIDAIEREVSEKYTELPEDVNGNTVRYGGYVKVYPYDGKPMKVKALRLSGLGWSVVFEDGSREHLYRVLACEPSTVEDVLLEACKAYHGLMTESMSDVAHDMPAPSEVIAEFAERLQLKEAE